MTKPCCVIGCKSNYKSSKQKAHIFSFPKDRDLNAKWIKAIGRKDFKPSRWAVVCHRHFPESNVITHSIGVDKRTGEQKLFPFKAKLKEGSVPSLHLNTASENCTQLSASPSSTNRKINTLTNNSTQESEEEISSDDDVPLERIKKQCISENEKNSKNIDMEHSECSDKSIRKKFTKLLEDYEQLKNKSIGLNKEIQVLECVNIELKCKIFK